MNQYAIIVKDEQNGKFKLVKEIKVSPSGLKIHFARKAESKQVLRFKTQDETCYVLDMIAALAPDLNISPIVIESKEEK